MINYPVENKAPIIAWCCLLIVSMLSLALDNQLPSISYDKKALYILTLFGSATGFWAILTTQRKLASTAAVITFLVFGTWNAVASIWGLLFFSVAYLIWKRVTKNEKETETTKIAHNPAKGSLIYGTLFLLTAGAGFLADTYLYSIWDSIYKVLFVLAVYSILLLIKTISFFEGSKKAAVTFGALTIFVLAFNELFLTLVFVSVGFHDG